MPSITHDRLNPLDCYIVVHHGPYSHAALPAGVAQSCNKIAEAEAALVCQRKAVVSDAYACAAEARRASGPPNPLAQCDMKVSGQLLPLVVCRREPLV